MEKNSQVVLKDVRGNEIPVYKIHELHLKSTQLKQGTEIRLESGEVGILSQSVGVIIKDETITKSVDNKRGKAAIVIQAYRSESGAKDAHERFLKHKYPNSIVVKSIAKECYEEVYSIDPLGSYGSVGNTPAIIVEQDLNPVIEAVNENKLKDLVKALIDAGLYEFSEYDGKPVPSSKFNGMLDELTKDAVKDKITKSADIEGATAISDSEAAGKFKDERSKDGTSDQGEGTKNGEAISDEEASGKFEGHRTEHASGEGVAFNRTEEEVSVHGVEKTTINKALQYFTSQYEAKQYKARNPDCEILPVTSEDRKQVGRRYTLKAVSTK